MSGGALQDRVRTAEQGRRPSEKEKMAQCQNKPDPDPGQEIDDFEPAGYTELFIATTQQEILDAAKIIKNDGAAPGDVVSGEKLRDRVRINSGEKVSGTESQINNPAPEPEPDPEPEINDFAEEAGDAEELFIATTQQEILDAAKIIKNDGAAPGDVVSGEALRGKVITAEHGRRPSEKEKSAQCTNNPKHQEEPEPAPEPEPEIDDLEEPAREDELFIQDIGLQNPSAPGVSDYTEGVHINRRALWLESPFLLEPSSIKAFALKNK
ncbi:hypothetical protein [Desulfobacter sp. UBA2225]|uniref:hypothetical protein n=1 Tax=Desulfobacter sp. UBA2225 TaxID=1961413 RepID=UPI00257E4507|nr:hypothetical protein [Desulfobacter sp. UBA2225]